MCFFVFGVLMMFYDFFPSRSADVRRLKARKKKLEVEKNG